MISKILVPTDGSGHAKKAVAFAADLAGKYGAELDLIHVMRDLGASVVPPEMRAYERIEHVEITERDFARSIARDILQAAAVIARDHGISKVESILEVGDPATKAVEYAQENGVDLIVMGTRGLGGLEALLVGSVARKIGHMASCTCVTVR